MLSVTNDKGIKFNIKVILQGENYGLNDCLTHEEKDPLIEFYDSRYIEGFDKEGQFVSSYYYSALKEHDFNFGLNLQGNVEDWEVSSNNMIVIMSYLQGFSDYQEQTAKVINDIFPKRS